MNVAELMAQLAEAVTKASRTGVTDSNKSIHILDEHGDIYQIVEPPNAVRWHPDNGCFFISVELFEEDEDD